MDNIKNLVSKVPKEVSYVTDVLEEAGFEAYLVGGCVRDLIIDRNPKDWDITTNANPDQIIALFDKTVYENNFGTVIVCVPSFEAQDVPYETQNGNVLRETVEDNVSHLFAKALASVDETFLQVEVTPYRTEEKYSDFRHPDQVRFSDRLEDDLKRRDFTVNAMALSSKGQDYNLTDMFNGIKDIKDKVLRTVGNPDERFAEDALRMMRAVRFACQLGFSVSYECSESILKNADLIEKISAERIRDEFS